VILLAVYSAGRYVAGAKALGVAVVTVAAIAATRIGFDPAVDSAGTAVMTVVAVAFPFLVGRWVHGQARLHRELEEKAARREREREQATRDAGEEERMRIAADLQAAVADRLREIVRAAGELPDRLAAKDHKTARELLASIADTARESLADVRRVLGILRRDGEAPLTPPAPSTAARVPATSASAAVAVPAAEAAGDEPSARWWTPTLVDRMLVAALVVGAEIELLATVPSGDRAFAALTAVAIAVPLLWRRERPVPVALAVLAAVGIQSAVLRLDSFPVSDVAALMCGAYAVGAYAHRRLAVAGLALLALGEALHAALFHPEAVAIALLGAAAVPWTVGRILRGQRLLLREAQDKATEIERTRARDARAAVTAERMRVARELHDAVAHNISVIAIQAAGADGVLERDPDRAAQCATLIEAVGREAIVELSRLSDLPSGGPPPSLARVDALAQRARDGGLPVELRVEGEPARLAAGVDLAAFRIVQEALANVSKHAGAARARVVVRYDPRAVELEIDDDGRGPNGGHAGHRHGGHAQPTSSAGTGGHGLIGMRERAALYGGTLDVGRRPNGGFAVRARLPTGRT
jgi:signal transduction histidine kinase